MLGKYSTKVVLPKSKSDLVRAINNLDQVDIQIWEPVHEGNINSITKNIATISRNCGSKVTIICIKNR